MRQKVILLGFVGKEPFIKAQPDGDLMASFNVATHRIYTNQKGEKIDETTWWTAYAYGRRAEVVRDYLTKRRQVYLEGWMISDPRTGGPRTFLRRDGSTGAAFEVKIIDMQMLGPRDPAAPGNGNGEGEPEFPPDFPEPDMEDLNGSE